MYKTLEEAKESAIKIINKLYEGQKNGCVISETKEEENSRKIHFGFHFYDKGTDGKFVKQKDGRFVRLTEI